MRSDGFRVEIETIFPCAEVSAEIRRRCGNAQEKVDAQVIADSNFFCPQKTGTLQKSAIVYTRIGSGTVIWRTPYARKQYYGENLIHPHAPNPNARAKWFEAAKALHKDDWRLLAENEIKRS